MRNFCFGLAAGLGLAAVPALAVPDDIVLPDWTVGKGGIVICKGAVINERLKHIDCLP